MSWLIADFARAGGELDINPLLIRAWDGKPVGVARAAMSRPGWQYVQARRSAVAARSSRDAPFGMLSACHGGLNW